MTAMVDAAIVCACFEKARILAVRTQREIIANLTSDGRVRIAAIGEAGEVILLLAEPDLALSWLEGALFGSQRPST